MNCFFCLFVFFGGGGQFAVDVRASGGGQRGADESGAAQPPSGEQQLPPRPPRHLVSFVVDSAYLYWVLYLVFTSSRFVLSTFT